MEELLNMPITDDDPIWADIGINGYVSPSVELDGQLLQPPATPRSPLPMQLPPADIPTADSALTDAEIDRLHAKLCVPLAGCRAAITESGGDNGDSPDDS